MRSNSYLLEWYFDGYRRSDGLYLLNGSGEKDNSKNKVRLTPKI